MIFVTVGSREYSFDRLLKELDKLIESRIITDSVVAQIGQSSYIPKNYQFIRFIGQDDFKSYQEQADLIISHGGTGALISALKQQKNVIAVPRLEKFKEHTDDHQLQITGALSEMGYIREVLDIEKLGKVYKEAMVNPITKGYSRPSNVLSIIENYIDSN